MTSYGYVRVSTDKQETGSDAQRRALVAAGCEQIIEERASGRKARPELARLIAKLTASDTLTVFRFDRISRTVADFYDIGQRIRDRGAALRSIVEHFDTGMRDQICQFMRLMARSLTALPESGGRVSYKRIGGIFVPASGVPAGLVRARHFFSGISSNLPASARSHRRPTWRKRPRLWQLSHHLPLRHE